jgi:hypothetical protein
MSSEDDFDELDHPGWFYRELIEDCLPWQQGQKINFKEFNQKYTLHDSSWIGIFCNIAYERNATLAIQWDAFWLPIEIKQNISVMDDWPYLFIQLLGIEQISTSNYIDIMGSPRTIAIGEFEEIQDKKFLAIDDVYGGQVNIVYQSIETFLAIEKNKRILEI